MNIFLILIINFRKLIVYVISNMWYKWRRMCLPWWRHGHSGVNEFIILLFLFIIFISYIIFIVYYKHNILSMIYACFKNFNTIPSSSEELHEQPETTQRYIFLKMLSSQKLETYSASVNHRFIRNDGPVK